MKVKDSCSPSSRLSRGCRAYQQQTCSVVNRSVASWRVISGLPCPSFGWFGGSCLDLAGLVKKFLSQEMSDDVSLQMGFQSIKKLLPDSCRCMESSLLDDLVRRLGEPPVGLPSGYLSFVKKEVRRLFPKGWDASYEKYCLTTAPPLSSCCESSREMGGSLGYLTDQPEFLSRVLDGRGGVLCPSYRGKLMVAQSAGKPRPLSKFPAWSLVLKPLHKTIYGSLSGKSWLLRGPPSRDALWRAGFKESSGLLVSGDYASATDNLPIEVMEVALATMLESSSRVPANVRELALRACRPILFSESESFEVRKGQMMGSLLSFPFLCLQNYLAFRWAVSQSGIRGRVPVLINGDDILFQTSVDGFPQLWFKVVARVGLRVEVTKTSVADAYGSLNSTLLRWVSGRLEPVWSPRFGMLRPAQHPGSLGQNFSSFLLGIPEALRYRTAGEWFKWHVGELRSAGVSLPSLGFRGLLCKRYAQKYGLLGLPNAVFPRFFHMHGVGFSGDFVIPVDSSAVDEELAFVSSAEIASAMWREGWAPVRQVSEAIQYCLARSAVKVDRFSYPAGPVPGHFGSSAEFDFLVRNSGVEARPSRRSLEKSFLSPVPVRDEILLVSTVVDDCLFDFGRGPLPPYSVEPLPGEFLETGLKPVPVFVCCG